MIKNQALKANLIQACFLVASITAIATLAGIAFFLFKEAFPTFLNPHPTSIHALVPVVNRDNQIWKQSINQKKLSAVYAGKLTDWRELGGDAGKIVVISYAETTPEGKKWRAGLLGEEALVADALKVESAREMTTALAGNKNAIGYLYRE